METLLMDLRYSVRMLLRNPWFSAVAILALALGIGANSAIFSVVNGILLRPLPYAGPDRLVAVFENNTARGEDRNEVAPANYLDWVAQSRSFTALGAYGDTGANLSQDQPERVLGTIATASVLPLLGVSPQLGRNFSAEEAIGAHPVVVLSDDLWHRRYGGDPKVLGHSLTMNGKDREIVGVMPAGFRFPPDQDKQLWVPLNLQGMPGMKGMAEDRSSRFLHVVGRLRPGASLAAARTEMNALAHQLELRFPDTNKGWGVTIIPLHEQLVGDIRPALIILLATTVLVLVIACSNVANLLLARATAREREVAVRSALGAARRRLIRQYLTESTLLALLGGALGLFLAYWGIRLLLALNPDYIPRVSEIGIDPMVLGFTLLVSLLTGVVFGLVPALKASRPDLQEQLKESNRGGAGGLQHNRLRSLLVISQTALALVLLIAAGLMVRSLVGLQSVAPGFNTGNLLTMELFVPPAKYPKHAELYAFHQRLFDRLRNIPGVLGADATTNLPLGGSDMTMSFLLAGQPPPASGHKPEVSFRGVTPGYFRTMGMTLLRGRSLSPTDLKETPRVAVVNQTMAEHFWPGASAVGQHIVSHDVPYEIVGVVSDIRDWGLESPVRSEMYVPLEQDDYYGIELVLRTGADPRGMVATVRQAVQSVDPGQPVFRVRRMDEVIAHSIARSNVYTRLLVVFGILALLLAALGIYSVIAYSVRQRANEIGIRIALGAQRRAVFGLIVGQGFALALAGIVLGLAVSALVTRALSSLLFGVGIGDPLTLAGAASVLAVVALLAAYLPARRATQIDPVNTLRQLT